MLRDGIGLCLNPYFLGSLSIFDAEPTQETRETSKSLFSWKPIYQRACLIRGHSSWSLNPYFLGSLSIIVRNFFPRLAVKCLNPYFLGSLSIYAAGHIGAQIEV